MATQDADNLAFTDVDIKTEVAQPKVRAPRLFSANHRKSTIIGAIFSATGISGLLVSIFLGSQIVALIGLGLTFWGALFILVTPMRYVEGTLHASTALSIYRTFDRIIGDLKYAEKAYYLPPYSREEYLPENLKGLKETVAFIPAKKDAPMPQIEDIAQSKFMLSNKRGVLVTPPGFGLLTETEKKMPPMAKIGINDLCEIIPKIMTEDFAIAKEIAMHSEADKVTLTICDSLYTFLYNPKNNLKSVSILGCPIAGAIACAIAKTTGKPVTIQKTTFSSETLTTEIEYHLVQG